MLRVLIVVRMELFSIKIRGKQTIYVSCERRLVKMNRILLPNWDDILPDVYLTDDRVEQSGYIGSVIPSTIIFIRASSTGFYRKTKYWRWRPRGGGWQKCSVLEKRIRVKKKCSF